MVVFDISFGKPQFQLQTPHLPPSAATPTTMRNFRVELQQAMDIFSPATALTGDELKELDEPEHDLEIRSYTEKTKKSLTAVCDTIGQAAEADIPESELKELTITATDHEESLVNWAYNDFNDHGLTDCLEIYSGNVVNDGSAATGGKFAGVGQSRSCYPHCLIPSLQQTNMKTSKETVLEYLAILSPLAASAIQSSE